MSPKYKKLYDEAEKIKMTSPYKNYVQVNKNQLEDIKLAFTESLTKSFEEQNRCVTRGGKVTIALLKENGKIVLKKVYENDIEYSEIPNNESYWDDIDF